MVGHPGEPFFDVVVGDIAVAGASSFGVNIVLRDEKGCDARGGHRCRCLPFADGALCGRRGIIRPRAVWKLLVAPVLVQQAPNIHGDLRARLLASPQAQHPILADAVIQPLSPAIPIIPESLIDGGLVVDAVEQQVAILADRSIQPTAVLRRHRNQLPDIGAKPQGVNADHIRLAEKVDRLGHRRFGWLGSAGKQRVRGKRREAAESISLHLVMRVTRADARQIVFPLPGGLLLAEYKFLPLVNRGIDLVRRSAPSGRGARCDHQ